MAWDEFGEEFADSGVDLVSDRPDLVGGFAGRSSCGGARIARERVAKRSCM